MRANPLPPKSILQRVPGIGAQRNIPDPMVYFKQFLPGSQWTWYCLEMNHATGECFGLVVGLETELGYYSQNELLTVRSPLGLTVENDRFFQPCPLSQLRYR